MKQNKIIYAVMQCDYGEVDMYGFYSTKTKAQQRLDTIMEDKYRQRLKKEYSIYPEVMEFILDEDMG